MTRKQLTATADDKTRVYGEANPAFTVSYAGFVNGNDASVLDTAPIASCAADATVAAGAYPIAVAGGVDDNYSFAYVPGTLTVTPAALTCTADDKSKVYGSENPTLTITYVGLKNGETAPSTPPTAACAATAASPVGTYPIALTGGADPNYALTLENGTLTVTRKQLTATADDKTRLYGESNPALTITYTGFVNGDSPDDLDTKPIATITAEPDTPPGDFPIVLNGGADDNYVLTLIDGVLVIEDAVQLTLRDWSWNLLALPFQPVNGSEPEQVLLGHGEKQLYIGTVFHWDAERQKYADAAPGIPPLTGFWAYSKQGGVTQLLHGVVEPNAITVFPGWNIVGVAVDTPLTDLLGTSPDVAPLIWWWDPIFKRYGRVPAGGELERGRGYWLYFFGAQETVLQP